jgi:hypothetical protein
VGASTGKVEGGRVSSLVSCPAAELVIEMAPRAASTEGTAQFIARTRRGGILAQQVRTRINAEGAARLVIELRVILLLGRAPLLKHERAYHWLLPMVEWCHHPT